MSDFNYQTLIQEIRQLQKEIVNFEDDVWTLMQINKKRYEVLRYADEAIALQLIFLRKQREFLSNRIYDPDAQKSY